VQGGPGLKDRCVEDTVQRRVAELEVDARVAAIRPASAWLERAALERGVPAEQVGRLDLCLNEALANIVSYGGAAALAAPVRLRLEVEGESAAVTVADAGVAFDPLGYSPPPRPQSLEETQPGGLGVMMIRSFSDELSYRYHDGRNCLKFGVRWATAA